MSTDTKIKTLIFNKLTQEQYDNADRVPTEFYLTPDTSIDSSEKGAANGVASLDTNGKVPTEQIPVATASSLGGVKPDGTTITVTEDGVISATGGSGSSTSDLQEQINSLQAEVSKMSGRPNYNAGVSITLKTNTSIGSSKTATYTVPSDGFIWVGEVSSKNVVYINNMPLGGAGSDLASTLIRTLIPVSAGDIIKVSTSDTAGSFSGFFAPNL